MNNLEILFATTVDKACGNASGSNVERFIKPGESTTLVHLAYLLDNPEPSIVLSVPDEEFFNSVFGIWLGGDFSDRCCRPIRMHKVWGDLGLRKNRVEQLLNLRHEEYMRRARVLTEKNGLASLMISLNESEIKSKPIPVHMHQGKTANI